MRWSQAFLAPARVGRKQGVASEYSEQWRRREHKRAHLLHFAQHLLALVILAKRPVVIRGDPCLDDGHGRDWHGGHSPATEAERRLRIRRESGEFFDNEIPRGCLSQHRERGPSSTAVVRQTRAWDCRRAPRNLHCSSTPTRHQRVDGWTGNMPCLHCSACRCNIKPAHGQVQ